MDNSMVTPQPDTPANNPEPVAPNPSPTPVISAPKSSKMKPILFVVIALILIAAAGFAGYKWEHNRAVKVENNLISQRDSLSNKVQQLEKASNSAKPAAPTSSTQYLKITQLGIEIPLVKGLTDLQYSYVTTPKPAALIFTSASLIKAGGSDCADTTDYNFTPLGVTTVSTSPISNGKYGDFIAKANGYYLYYKVGQSACSSSVSAANLQTSQHILLETELQGAVAY